jgi:hypothetical protein
MVQKPKKTRDMANKPKLSNKNKEVNNPKTRKNHFIKEKRIKTKKK